MKSFIPIIGLSLIAPLCYAEISSTDGNTNNTILDHSQSQAVIMISIYEHSSGLPGFEFEPDHTKGDVDINVGNLNASSIILVLNSYGPVNWVLSGIGVNNIDKIIMHGYYDQTIQNQSSSTTVEEYTFIGTGSMHPNADYGTPYDKDDAFYDYIEAKTGFPLTEYAGIYQGNDFKISENFTAEVGNAALNMKAAHCFEFESAANKLYVLHTSEDLVQWTETDQKVVGDGTAKRFWATADKAKEFYKVIILE
jgi:hypothetical protein